MAGNRRGKKIKAVNELPKDKLISAAVYAGMAVIALFSGILWYRDIVAYPVTYSLIGIVLFFLAIPRHIARHIPARIKSLCNWQEVGSIAFFLLMVLWFFAQLFGYVRPIWWSPD